MKYAREIKVGVLAAVCLFLLFFGLNFLKGVNIFSPTNSYHGVFYNLHGLEEQAAVYIRGHRVGQVDVIHYDFTADSAFTVDLSIRKDIALPQGTAMALVSDGLLGGMAVELQFPENTNNADLATVENVCTGYYGIAQRRSHGAYRSGNSKCGLLGGIAPGPSERRTY